MLIFGVSLVETTKVEESDEVYYTKLGLSMGRSKILIIYSHVI